MIDLHIHILPGIDDGAQSWDDAVEMAEMAAESGVDTVAATVHSNLPGKPDPREAALYLKQLKEFRQILEEEKIPLTVLPGMEIFAGEEFLKRLQKGQLLSLNQTRYVLMEFPMDVPAAEIYRILFETTEAGYLPVLAHPERYFCVQKVPAHVYEWYQMGIVIQINKGSILGRFGKKVQRTADSLLRHKIVTVAASDAHSPYIRTPDMVELKEVLRENYGESVRQRLLTENPRRILRGEKTLRTNPVPYDYS